eukprot:48778_1
MVMEWLFDPVRFSFMWWFTFGSLWRVIWRFSGSHDGCYEGYGGYSGSSYGERYGGHSACSYGPDSYDRYSGYDTVETTYTVINVGEGYILAYRKGDQEIYIKGAEQAYRKGARGGFAKILYEFFN